MKLNPEVKSVWSVGIFLSVIFWTIIISLVDYIVLRRILEIELISFGIIETIIFIFGLIFTFVYPHFAYKYWEFEIRNDDVFIEHGVFTRIKTLAPYSRIQHIDVRQRIFERYMGLSTLILYTAGSRGVEVYIPGLPLYFAEELRDKLKNYIKEDIV